jgi:dTDP-4-dehydrorhamnose 3,5-epimerase
MRSSLLGSDAGGFTEAAALPYSPSAEHGASLLDPALGLPWPTTLESVLSEEDAAALALADAARAGALPAYADCEAWYVRQRRP